MNKKTITICLAMAVTLASFTVNADEWQRKLQSVIRQFDTNAVIVIENGAWQEKMKKASQVPVDTARKLADPQH